MNFNALLADLDQETLVIAGIIAVGFLVLVLLALAMPGGKESKVKSRVEMIRDGRRPTAEKEAKIRAIKSQADSEIAALDRLIKGMLPRRDLLLKRLERAGIEAPLGRYLGICFGIGITVSIVAFVFLPVPPLALPFIAIIAGLGFPHLVIGIMGSRRKNKFIELFPEAIDLMVRGLKSGLPIGESIKNAGEEVADPVGIEMRRITDAVRLGTKLDQALWETADRLEIQDFKFFTVSLAIQSETGGNLAETLANLSSVLRGRRQLKLKIKAMSSEAKASAYIIGCLPFVVGFMIYLVNPEYIMKLFTDPRGHFMLGIGAAMFMVGGGVMFKMVKFEI